MKTLRFGLMALACAGGIGASAQAPTAFETQATSMASACLSSDTSTPEAAGAAIVTCEKLIVDIDALRQANPSISGHDLNVFLVVRGMGESRVAGSYGRIDGVRSARVCDRMERNWTLTSQLNQALSPTYADLIGNLVGSAIPAVSKCRQEFGAPVGAAPLPAG